jgi:hypothetical protein
MRNQWLVFCGMMTSSLGLVVGALDADEPIPHVRSLPVGDATINIVSREFGESRLLFCNLHDDEETSVEAAVAVLERRRGRLVELRHSGRRNCEFRLDERKYAFDPNRIFTPVGVKATLEKLSQTSPTAEKMVGRFGEALLALYAIDDVDVVAALHNNSDARYSAVSYLDGNELEVDAADVFIAKGTDTDDFFFVTDRRLFDALKKRHQNVVLQDNETATDDGSLSVYCGQHGKPYVNVEAQHGHLEQQINMLNQLFDVMEELELGP